MNAIAKGRNLRVSPLKMRKIIRWLPGRNVMDALAMLKVLPNKAAKMAYKVIASAQANYQNRNPEGDPKSLKIETIFADQAPILRRIMPRARGRADVIRKQSTHLTVVLAPIVAE
jgi:large subunit ribosomal protein L22